MQYYTPIPSGGLAHPGNPFSETQPSCRPPQIIGEGDVASIVLPDGSLQLYFVPTQYARCPPGPHYPSYVNPQHSPWNPYTEAWVIRSIPDQLLAYPYVSRQPCQPENSNPSFLQSRTGFQLKFHNDGCTSTTDIHHFDPYRLRSWFPRQNNIYNISNCAAQAEHQLPPAAPSAPRPVGGQTCRCVKPCHCLNTNGRTDQDHNMFLDASYENDKSKIRNLPRTDFNTSCDRSSSVELLTDKKQKKNTRFGDKNPRGECASESGSLTSNKATATFAEQATDCCPAERETQTGAAPARRADADAVTELWYPATPRARAALYSESDIAGASDTDD